MMYSANKTHDLYQAMIKALINKDYDAYTSLKAQWETAKVESDKEYERFMSLFR